MKLIIEIPEEDYNHVKSLCESNYMRSIPLMAIANGTPYNPSGDAISREALRKTICDMNFDFGDYYDHTDEIIDRICEKIDSAQVVSLPNDPIISDIPKDYLYDTETVDFYVYRNKYTGKEIHIVKNPPSYILDKRPKGEWMSLNLAKKVITKFKGYLDDDMIGRIQYALEKENKATNEQ